MELNQILDPIDLCVVDNVLTQMKIMLFHAWTRQSMLNFSTFSEVKVY